MNLPRRPIPGIFGSLLIFALVSGQPSFSQLSTPGLPREKAIRASAQARISAVLGRDQRAYRAAVRLGGFRMENPKQRLAAEFTGAEVRLQAGTADWRLTLQGYGYGDRLIAGKIVTPRAAAAHYPSGT